jgi:hypothetical protein
MAKLNSHWLERLQVIGKAQARYLWILLVTMLFYLALTPRVSSPAQDTPLVVPVVNLELSGKAVLSFGPVVLSFLVLAILGSLRAFGHARKQLGLKTSGDWSGEELDTSPNAIDLSLYTTSKSPKVVATVAHFAYPAFLLTALVEAAWLEKRLIDGQDEQWYGFAVAGALLWLPAVWLVIKMIYDRIHQIPILWKTK